MKEWKWPDVSSKPEKEITFPCRTSIQTVKAAELRFSSRWCRRFGCRLLSWSCCNQILQLREAIQKRGEWREIMFLEIRAIPHSLALTHADTALILQYARNTWLKLSCPVSPTSHYGRGCGVKFRSVWKRVCVQPKIWSHPSGTCPSSAQRVHSITAHHVWRKQSGDRCDQAAIGLTQSHVPATNHLSCRHTSAVNCSHFSWNQFPQKHQRDSLQTEFTCKKTKIWSSR